MMAPLRGLAIRAKGVFLLSLVSGTIDLTTFWRGLTFSSGMSGNVLALAQSMSQGEWEASLYYALILGVFVLGSWLSHVAFAHLSLRLASGLVTANTVACVLASEGINAVTRVPMYPTSRVHWEILFNVFCVAFHNEFSLSMYGFNTVTLITVSSQKAIGYVYDVVVLGVAKKREAVEKLVLESGMILGYALGCGWLAVYNALTTQPQHYWIGSAPAVFVFVNWALDQALLCAWGPRGTGS